MEKQLIWPKQEAAFCEKCSQSWGYDTICHYDFTNKQNFSNVDKKENKEKPFFHFPFPY